ncbi:hypothetical protein PBY51_015666 [Eleginops maclovinus]|uniref:Uncharacterized protein n=1 Tax=Eleginops maclovinus TaxID=56733 RepID=A0AAN7XP09_ELEMC|nr:hypothetical protein PBY51_015666 [Eleginops maclovinus]
MWLTHDVLVPENTKEAVSMMIKDLILQEASKTTPTPCEQEDQTTTEEPDHQSGLFSAYRNRQKKDS